MDSASITSSLLAVGLGMTATALVTLRWARSWVRRLYPATPLPEVSRYSAIGVLLVGLSAILAGALAGLASGLAGSESPAWIVQSFLQTAFLWIVVLASAGAVMLHAGVPIAAGLGLTLHGNRRALLAGAGAVLLLEPALFGVTFLWTAATKLLGIEVGAQPVMQAILASSDGDLVFACMFAVFLIPLCEELAFRGFLQPWLVERLGGLAGIVVTSAAFALLHGRLFSGPIFALSLLLGWLRLRTGKTISAWTAHALHNAVALGVAFGWPGAS